MNRYYTIYDIERALTFQFRDKWHEKWTGFSVYSDEIVIYAQKDSIKLYEEQFSDRDGSKQQRDQHGKSCCAGWKQQSEYMLT